MCEVMNSQNGHRFFIGAVLHGEIKRIVAGDETNIIIGGKAQIKNAM